MVSIDECGSATGKIEHGRTEGVTVMRFPRYPSLYQINTRVRLAEISAELG